MSITKNYGRFVFICDGCQDDLETNEAEWELARKVFRKEGWHDKRVPMRFGGSVYRHYCSVDCED